MRLRNFKEVMLSYVTTTTDWTDLLYVRCFTEIDEEKTKLNCTILRERSYKKIY